MRHSPSSPTSTLLLSQTFYSGTSHVSYETVSLDNTGDTLTRFEEHFDPLGQHVRFFTRRSRRDTLDHAGFEGIETRRARALVGRAIRR